eukprot:SAG22_NODE_689_length_7904_cov_3.365279_5_plen_369_part_00
MHDQLLPVRTPQQPIAHDTLNVQSPLRTQFPGCVSADHRLCDEQPYHLGFTCTGFSLADGARKCRFCSVPLTEDILAPDPPAEVLADCCTAADCLGRRATACHTVLPCGHPCGGLKEDEAHYHPPCLVCGARPEPPQARCPRCEGPFTRFDSRDRSVRNMTTHSPAVSARRSCDSTTTSTSNSGAALRWNVVAAMAALCSGWSCDGRNDEAFGKKCGSGITDFNQTKGMVNYQCARCDFDYCEKCFDRAAPPVPPASIDLPVADGGAALGLTAFSGLPVVLCRVLPSCSLPSHWISRRLCSDFCSICWTEPLEAAPFLQSRCGHVFHAHCLQEIVKQGRANQGKALSFDYLNCPACRQLLQVRVGGRA